jgi:hypothetical protein
MSPAIPHTPQGYAAGSAVVSCHVERPLDDRVWELFSRLQERRPGGFAIAALMRPPDERAGEPWEPWLERAREASARGRLGQHTHWTSPTHARPEAGVRHVSDPGFSPAERVCREAERLRAEGLDIRLFCGGGWYMDEEVAEALADLGYTDLTATAFRPSSLTPGAARLALRGPARLRLPSGATLPELPSTHSLGMLARGVLGRLNVPLVHAYFHDTDLLDRRRRLALVAALTILGRRRTPGSFELGDAHELSFGDAAAAA